MTTKHPARTTTLGYTSMMIKSECVICLHVGLPVLTAYEDILTIIKKNSNKAILGASLYIIYTS